MGTVHPIIRPPGRLHDPPLQIVERVQAAMGDQAKTVSADAKGNLFISDFNAHADGLEAGRGDHRHLQQGHSSDGNRARSAARIA